MFAFQLHKPDNECVVLPSVNVCVLCLHSEETQVYAHAHTHMMGHLRVETMAAALSFCLSKQHRHTHTHTHLRIIFISLPSKAAIKREEGKRDKEKGG